jgi:hypothetical protein
MLIAEELAMGKPKCLKARPSEHERNRAHQDLNVLYEGPRLHVLTLDSHLFIKRQRVMAVCLPRASQPLRNCKSERHMLAHLSSLAWEARPGANKTHLASKDIDELRQFIHKTSPEDLPDASYSRVVLCLEERPVGMIQVKDFIDTLGSSISHRAELVQPEAPTMHANPFLHEKDLAWATQFHGHDNANQHRA